ncbi:MAG: hypothetical protein K1X82_00175 [Bacteroidia bacterium]|nr:hypothetical protein [Bacteroidia bacterium]
MKNKFEFKRDSKLTGFILGLLFPPVFMFLYWLFLLQNKVPDLVISRLYYENQLAPFIGLAQIANAGLFFYFIKKWDADESGKGVIFAMLFYGAIILYLKLDTIGS